MNALHGFSPFSDFSSNGRSEGYNQDVLNSERLIQSLLPGANASNSGQSAGGTKIDPVFAAAAAAALNATLANPSVPSNSLYNQNSSATVAAVAAAAMNAAALAAALGGAANAPGSGTGGGGFQLPGFGGQHATSGRQRRSPLDDHRRQSSSGNYRAREREPSPPYRSNGNRHSSTGNIRSPEDDPHATRTIFVGNLPLDIRASELREIFESYGILEDVDIKRIQSANNSEQAYAFLKFVNVSMAYRAKLGMTGKQIAGYTCKIGYGKVTPTRCLWVGGLGPWITYPMFAALVDRFCHPRKIIWPSGKSYANILFSTTDEAAGVANALRGYTIGAGGRHRLRVDFTDESHMLSSGTIDFLRRGHMSRDDERMRRRTSRRYSPTRTSRHPQRSVSRSPSQGAYAASVSPRRSVTPCITSRSPSPSTHILPEDISVETATNIDDLAACLPGPVWKAVFVLKKSNFSCRLFAVSGDTALVDQFIPRQKPPQTPPEEEEEADNESDHKHLHHSDDPPLLRISQRMKMDPSKLVDVRNRIKSVGENGYCVLLAMEAGEASSDSQSRPLRDLINYLASKEAAGVVLMNSEQSSSDVCVGGASGGGGEQDSTGVLHVLPPGDFAVSLLVEGGAAGLQTRNVASAGRFLVILLIRSYGLL